MNLLIREIRNEEIYLLKCFLYEAIFQRDKKNKLPRSIVEEPELDIYIRNFGKEKDDHCLVADYNGNIVGAVWVRILQNSEKGYGNVDSLTPEFAISLFEEYRNKGIGSKMMKAMLIHLRDKGYKKTSLAVQKDNYAVKMYTE